MERRNARKRENEAGRWGSRDGWFHIFMMNTASAGADLALGRTGARDCGSAQRLPLAAESKEMPCDGNPSHDVPTALQPGGHLAGGFWLGGMSALVIASFLSFANGKNAPNSYLFRLTESDVQSDGRIFPVRFACSEPLLRRDKQRHRRLLPGSQCCGLNGPEVQWPEK
jgi:hypothetical protein